MNLKKSLPKKFLKKNLLLQKDLEAFLYWRQSQEKHSRQIYFQKSHSSFNLLKDGKKQPYKPIQFKLLKALWPKEFFFLTFFSEKKSFMKLWFFPFSALACLTFLQANEKSSVHFPSLEVMKPVITRKTVTTERTSEPIQTFFFSKQNPSNENQLSPEVPSDWLKHGSMSFVKEAKGTYFSKKLKVQLNHKHDVVNEIEKLCSFYLTQTTTKLNPLFKDDFQSTYSRDLLVNKFWFQSKKLNKGNFDWIWYSLKPTNEMIIDTSALKNNVGFVKKLKTPDSILESKKTVNSFILEPIEIPHLDYFEASIFLDNWIKRSRSLTAFEITEDKLNPIQISELILKDFDRTKKGSKSTQFVSHLFSLSKQIQQNQAKIKTIDLTLTPEFSFLTNCKTDFINAFKVSFLEKYNIDCLKLWFKNYLQNNTLKIKLSLKKQILEDKKLQSLNFFHRVKTKSSISKIFKETLFLNNFQNPAERILHSPTLFRNQKKLSTHFKKLNLLKIRETKSSLFSNVALDEQKFYSKTYELMLLKNWNLILKSMIKQDPLNSGKFVYKKEQETNLNQLLYELNIYRKFSKLSSSILDLKQECNKTLDQKSGKTNFIFSYQNPILKGNIQSSLADRKQSLDRRSLVNPSFALGLDKFEIGKKQLISKPQLSLKQNLFIQNNYFGSKAGFVDFDKTFSENLDSKNKTNLLRFHNDLTNGHYFLKQFLLLSKFFNKKAVKPSFSSYFLFSLKEKNFFVSKSFNLKKRQIIFLKNLKVSKTKLKTINKEGFSSSMRNSMRKQMKQKIDLTMDFPDFSTESRKIEKIFRTYNSIKCSQSQNVFKFLDILNKPVKKNYSNEVSTSNWNSSTRASQSTQRKLAERHRKKNKRLTTDWSISQNILTLVKQKIREKRTFYNRQSQILSYQSSPEKSTRLQKMNKSILDLNASSFKIEPKRRIQNLRFVANSKNQKLTLSSSNLSKKLTHLIFFKKADFLNNSLDSIRFENQKRLEKKRRLKKLKLENRRRKKRKRFYPRPLSLRVQLYSSFIKSRYQPVQKKNFQRKNLSESFLNKSVIPILKKTVSTVKISNKTNLRKRGFNNNIYGLNKQRWGNVINKVEEKASLQRLLLALNKRHYHESEFYKISNDILADFEKLCWKSYWLRSNIKPYIHKIQNNLKQIHVFERLKSNNSSFNFLVEQSTKSITAGQRETFRFLKNKLGKQMGFSKISLYPNTKAALEDGLNNLDNSTFFKILEKKTEYDKLLFNRIHDQIKNVKSQLNVNGENQARSYKTGRQKFEISSNLNPLSSISNLGKNVFEPTISNLPVFSVSNDNLVKPFGDMPTLRILWACHQTNLLTYRNTNFSNNLWSTYKHREQLKSNKTRKILLKIFNLYDNWASSTGFQKNLNTMTQTKNNLISKKIQTLLGPINHENNPSHKTRVRKIKFRVNAHFDKFSQNQHEVDLFKRNIELNSTRQSLWFETPLQTKLQKLMPHFWWSTKQQNPIETSFPFFFETPVSFLDLNQYLGLKIKSNQGLSLAQSCDFDFNQTFVFTTFWFSCLFFHLSVLFALIRIPEIRNVLKFQFLILSKLGNTYLTAIFSVYRFLSLYKTKLSRFVQQSTFIFKSLKKSNNETTIFSNDQCSKEFFEFNNKSFPFQLNSASFVLITKKLMIDKKLRLNLQKNLDLTLVTSFRCRLFFQSIKMHFVETQKQKLEPLIGLDNQNVFLVFSSTDPFYKYKTNQHWNLFFNQNNKFLKQKNYIYDFFNGWQWYVNNKNQSLALNQRKSELLKHFIQNSEQAIGNSLQPKKEFKNYATRSGATPTKIDFSFWKNSTSQFQSFLALLSLYVTKVFIQMFYFSFVLFYKLLFSIVDCMESFLFVFYKFFEKPAELMVSWIADFFLVEWSSNLTNYVPDAFDRDLWISFFKFSRLSRIILPVPFGFLIQRIFLISNEIFYSWLLKPDSDLMSRQRKGIVFWDIWSEILILAAEQYKMNLSSLSTLKEEQELLIENLLREKIVLERSSEKPTSKSKLKNSLDLSRKSGSKTSKSFQLLQTPNLSQTKSVQDFFGSPSWNESFEKLEPLLTFLKTQPLNPTSLSFKQTVSKKAKEFTIELFQQFQTIDLSISNLQLPMKSNTNQFYPHLNHQNSLKTASEVVFDWMKSDSSTRWSVNQALTTQGRDTDLFMDIHPPKSFLHVGFLKNYLAPQEILGLLVCDICSGQFPMKISKNILIVGPPGRTKSFFIQALAGETESKIVIDNAHRYTFMNGGVPIGMKLLREVFDSIALHTPCLFLLEDIHVIGERRPMLISDDEISKSKTDTFGAEQEEVHEKDRSIYQLSRHALSHYNRPYKGDFSLSIPTNHFCYDLFLGTSAIRKRRSSLSTQSPLPLKTIEQNLTSQQKTEAALEKAALEKESFDQSNSFVSFLQLSLDQVFAPPVTSPFNILLLKEQKKLKPKKILKELPWSGLSNDQLMLISKTSYSIRVKVALLAELSMTNLSMKLDMITDLLVIIDSVRSNRGFVVFATTHLPALLDPALRRPGRLDETISLPILPNLINRFEIFKLRTCFKNEPFDFFDYSLLSPLTNENQIESLISKGMLLLLNTKGKVKKDSKPIFYSNFVKDYSVYSVSQAFRSIFSPNSAFVNAFGSLKAFKLKTTNSLACRAERRLENWTTSVRETPTELPCPEMRPHIASRPSSAPTSPSVLLFSNDKLPYLPLTYSKAGRILIEALLLHNHSIYSTQFFQSSTMSERLVFKTADFKMLYSSKSENNNIFIKLFAGKISEFFVFSNVSPLFKKPTPKLFTKPPFLNPSQGALFDTLNGSDTYWKSALNFLDSFFQKRYLYNKNLIASKLLFLEDQALIRQAPSPPNSSILMPAKKFENYKRTLRDFTQKPMLTINEKIQSHQQQRFLKLLYNVSLQNSFKTTLKSNLISQFSLNENFSNLKSTNFYSSFKELGYLDLITLKPSSVSSFYKNRFRIRHRFSFLNQWWNAQLAEHNIETTYLSHVDWRSMFVPSIGDLIIDFPDAEQYYNPRSRRWFINSNSWSYWFDFDQQYRTAIYQHYIYQAFMTTSEFLNHNRELLDYLAFRFLRQHQLKEIDLISALLRFERKTFIFKK